MRAPTVEKDDSQGFEHRWIATNSLFCSTVLRRFSSLRVSARYYRRPACTDSVSTSYLCRKATFSNLR